jgi:inorganic pyrophosphatase
MTNSNNPLHSVSLGENFPEIVKAIIEIPSGAKAKYELDKESGLLRLDRVLFSSVHYPANYGFIPRTHCEDGDPLDILVLSQTSVVPLCIVEARVIGAMHMVDQGQSDDKIIAVAIGDMSVQHINDVFELPKHLLQEVQRFFEDYKKLEHKHVEVAEFSPRAKAVEIVKESALLYTKLMSSK